MSAAIGWIVTALGRERAWRLGRALYMRARGEKATNAIGLNGEAALIGRAVRAGDRSRPMIALDVGANLGEWSHAALSAARAHDRAVQIHVFEPTPAAAERLKTVFAHSAETSVHQIALSDTSGAARFAVFGDTAGTNSLEITPDGRPVQTIEVATETGASFAARMGLAAIDIVKIDTEGHDFAVLLGFEPLLAKGAVGALQFEYNSRWLAAHRSLRDVFELAARTGYRLGRVMPDGIELIPDWNPECDRYFEDNFALVRADLMDSLGARSMRWSVSNTLQPGDG